MRTKTAQTQLEDFRADIGKCVRCGACSAVCPSFRADRRESRSPRGRMALIEAVLAGKLAVSKVYRDRLATCAGCLACETACASGVPFSRIIQAAKEQAISEAGPGIVAGVVSSVLKHPALMRSLAWLAPVALHYSGDSIKGQGSGVRGQGKNIPASPHPRVSAPDSKGRVAFFPGCGVRYFQPDIGRAVHAVLEALGYEVVVPAGLVCCGRPYLSLGDRSAAEGLARKNAAILTSLDTEAVVTACASCGLTFKKDQPGPVASPGGRHVQVLDIHEFLEDRLDGRMLRPLPVRVTWHDPCHLGRGQGLAKTARNVLRTVPGIELAEMKDPERCCGFGGVMRLSHPLLSGAIGGKKAGDIVATGASLAVTGCPGCRMQLSDSLRRAGSQMDVVHTVQVLEKALRNAECGVRSTEETTSAPKR